MANNKKYGARKVTPKKSAIRRKTKEVDTFACGCCRPIVTVDDCGCLEPSILC
jgi:hypothetical protein